MMVLRGFVGVALAASLVAAEEPAAERLQKTESAVEERIAGLVQAAKGPGLRTERADEAARAAETLLRSRAVLAPEHAAARGRAWRDLGLGTGAEAGELIAAIEGDLAGMTLDASRVRLLVDPSRLPDEVVRGDPDSSADASVMLATGVAPDEPVAGHYIAHVLLDGPPLTEPATTDAILARAALSEGSANLAALVLLFGGVGLEAEVVSGAVRPEDALGGRLVPATLHSASPLVKSLLEFVYLDGFAQAAALAKTGGFPRLTKERARRRATSDVLHVDRPPTTPAAIAEPVLPAGLGLSVVDRDSLGEQGIVTLVAALTGKDNLGLIAGDGWAGDALWRFESGSASGHEGEPGATFWVTNWKSEEDAKDFVYSLERCLQARFPGETMTDDAERGRKILRRPDRVYRLAKTGFQVSLGVATPAIDLEMNPETKKKAPARQPSKPKK